jgi:hypothetical protein
MTQVQLPGGQRVPGPVHVQGLEEQGAGGGAGAQGQEPAAPLHHQQLTSEQASLAAPTVEDFGQQKALLLRLL